MDNITATKSSLEELEVKSTACTARPDKIDGDWLSEINSNTQLQAWWTSDKPRKLKKVCHLEARSSQNSTTDQCYQQTQSSSEGRNQHNSTRPSAARAPPQRYQQDHSNQITPSHTVVYNNSIPNRNRRTNAGNSRPQNRPSQQYQNSTRYPNDSSQRQQLQGQYSSQRQYCNNCKRSGHSDNNCFKQKQCEFCHRRGHTAEDCRTRLNEQRQERFFRNLASEQAQHNAILVQSLQRFWTPQQANSATATPGNWQGTPSYHPQQHPQQHPHYHQQAPANLHAGTWNNGTNQ